VKKYRFFSMISPRGVIPSIVLYARKMSKPVLLRGPGITM